MLQRYCCLGEWRGGTPCLGILLAAESGGGLGYTTETVWVYASPLGVSNAYMGVVGGSMGRWYAAWVRVGQIERNSFWLAHIGGY